MYRFPNPGSDIRRFIQVFKDVFSERVNNVYSVDSISYIMAITQSASAVGSVGLRAFQKSKKKDKSRDSIYNQAKAYAEAYRWLGWLYGDSLNKFKLTPIGKMIVNDDYKADPIFKTCFVCWNTPNENIKSKACYKGYPILNILYTARSLDNKISRDEMILGPLNEKYGVMGSAVSYIRNMRNGKIDLKHELAMQPISVNTQRNYTRLVLAGLKYTGLMKQINDQKYLTLTQSGIKLVSRKKVKILTLDDKDNESKLKDAFFWFLKSSEFRVDPYEGLKEIIGSPYQTFTPLELDKIFVNSDLLPECLRTEQIDNLASSKYERQSDYIYSRVKDIVTDVNSTEIRDSGCSVYQVNKETKNLLLDNKTKKILDIIGIYKKEKFYPFIADLFNIIGFNATVSPNGQNAQRADLVLYYQNKTTVPVEVKSKTEVSKINIKAIEQAVENKIILESRKNTPSFRDDSSFVVGFDYPNSLRENDLIDACDKVYGIKVLMISASDLIKMAKGVLESNKKWDIEKIIRGKGKLKIE